MKRWICVGAMWSLTTGMSGFPPYPPAPELQCDPPKMVGAFKKIQCSIRGYPYAIDTAHVKFMIPPGNGPFDLVTIRHGYTRFPITCTNDGVESATEIVIMTCAPYEPDQLIYSPPPYNWGGPLYGVNYEGFVLGAAVEYAAITHMSVNWAHGLTLRGSSEGGDFGVFQAMIMPEPWRSLVTVVDAKRVHTMFTICPPSPMTCKLPDAQRAWGNYDIRQLDIQSFFASGRADNIYYSIHGATNDDLGFINRWFFVLCDYYHIMCRGTWDLGGHELYGELGVNLPRITYEDSAHRPQDQRAHIIFTQFSANQYGPRGHYNIGLSGYQDDQGRVFVRYRRYTNLGGGLPDMPQEATVNIAVRDNNGLRRIEGVTVVADNIYHLVEEL